MFSTCAKVTALCCMLFALMSIVGCTPPSPEVSAMTKVATGQVNKLTGPEIQALADKFAPGSLMTAEQAEQIAAFLATSEVKTLADFMPLVKVATGQMDTLTSADILSLAAKFAPNANLTQEQAEGIVAFIAAHQIKTMADVQALVAQAQADPTSVTLPPGMVELFNNLDTSTLPTTAV